MHEIFFAVPGGTTGFKDLSTSQVYGTENENKMKNQISVLRPFPGPSLAGAAREDLYFKGLLAEHLHSRVSSLGVLGGRFEPS